MGYEKQKELLDNIAGNVNLTETLERVTGTDTESSSNSKSNANGNSKNVFLDTPQGNEYKGTIDNTDYATNVTFGKSDSESNINDNSRSSGTGTENYIKKVLNRITVLGATFLVIIAAIPIALPAIWSVADSVSSQIQLGGTGLIIVTGVALETVKQINTYLTRREYKGYIRK